MIHVVGEVLFDIFPDYRRLGGAPMNVACHLHRFGESVLLISRIGRDPEGFEVLAEMGKLGMDVSAIQLDDFFPTGRAMVSHDVNGIPQFHIPASVAFDQLEVPNDELLSDPDSIHLLYIGTLIQRTPKGMKTLQRLFETKSSATKCMVDLNLRPGCYNRETVLASLKYADILKVNEEELLALRDLTGNRKKGESLVVDLQQQFAIPWLAVTRGAQGSSLCVDGKYFDQAAIPVEICDTVGAGDGFSALLALGCARNLKPDVILQKAVQFSSHICRVEGALPTSDAVYVQLMRELCVDHRQS